MTDRRGTRRKSPGTSPIVVAALGGFLALLALLSIQMRAGADPSLKFTATKQQPRILLQRRIVKTRVIIITDGPPATSGGSPSTSQAAVTASASASAPAPVTAAPVHAAPVQAAPVAIPAPPPAPVTRTS